MANTVRNPYLKPSTTARPAAPPSPPQRRNCISLLSPDDVGLGSVLAAVARVDLDADDGRLVDDEGVGGLSLSAEPSIVYTDQTIDDANTACSRYQWNVPVLRTNQRLSCRHLGDPSLITIIHAKPL